MFHDHINRMSPIERLESAIGHIRAPQGDSDEDKLKSLRSAAHEILYDLPRVTEETFYSTHVATLNNEVGRAMETRCIEILEESIEKDREPLWFLDMARDRNLFSPVARGVKSQMFKRVQSSIGRVRFIADKTDDWPNGSGGPDNTDYLETPIHYFGTSIHYGIIEQWCAAREGTDIAGDRVRDAREAIDCFMDEIICFGSPLHKLSGMINNDCFDLATVPESKCYSEPCIEGTPLTKWANKDFSEIKTDIDAGFITSFKKSRYNAEADIVLLPHDLWCYASILRMSRDNATTLLQCLKLQYPDKQFVPIPKLDESGTDGCAQMIFGNFNRQNIRIPYLPPVQLDVEYHGSKWKIGIIGATGGVVIPRPERFCIWEGM